MQGRQLGLCAVRRGSEDIEENRRDCAERFRRAKEVHKACTGFNEDSLREFTGAKRDSVRMRKGERRLGRYLLGRIEEEFIARHNARGDMPFGNEAQSASRLSAENDTEFCWLFEVKQRERVRPSRGGKRY